MSKAKRDIFNSIGLLLFSSIIYIGVREIPIKGAGKTEADFFPKLMIGIIVLLTLLLLINSIIKLIKSKKVSERKTLKNILGENKKVILTFVVFAGYLLLLDYVGYFIASILFLVSLYLVLVQTKRHFLLTTFGAIVITLLLYVIFQNGLSVFLPKGILF